MDRGETLPFIIAAIGVLLDALTTNVGLSMGYYESHPNYNPLIALTIFWSLIAVAKILPRTRLIRIFTFLLSITPFLGMVNNSLVIMGVFPGLDMAILTQLILGLGFIGCWSVSNSSTRER